MNMTDAAAYDGTGYVFAVCEYVPLNEERNVPDNKSEIFTIRFPLITEACTNLLMELEDYSKNVACEPFATLYFRKWLVNPYGGTAKTASELGSCGTEVFGELFTAIRPGEALAEYADGRADFSHTFGVPDMNETVCGLIADSDKVMYMQQKSESISMLASDLRTFVRNSVSRYNL